MSFKLIVEEKSSNQMSERIHELDKRCPIERDTIPFPK